MMSVVDWDPIFPGPPQKSLVEPLHSLAVHFDRSAGKDVKQKHKPSCNIKRWINLLTKDSSLVSVVNVSSYYVYMMNGRKMNQSKCDQFVAYFFQIHWWHRKGTWDEARGFYRESVDGAVSTVFRTPPYLVLAVKLGSPDREKITCIDPVASCKENASAHFFLIQVY